MNTHKVTHRISSPLPRGRVSATARRGPFRAVARALHSLSFLLVIATVLVPALIMSAGTAYALDPGWPTWLANPPEIVGDIATKVAPIGTIVGGAAEVAVPAAEAGGAAAGGVGAAGVVLVGGAGVLSTVGTVKLLNWWFGDNGDDRGSVDMTIHPGFVQAGWSWASGTCCNDPAYPIRSEPWWGDYSGRASSIGNHSGATHTLTRHIECVATATRAVSYTIDDGPVTLTNGQGWEVPHFDCPNRNQAPGPNADVVSHATFTDENGQLVYSFRYDPPMPWTVNVVQYCRNASGVPITATSTPYSFTPQGGTAPQITVPDCPSGYEPEAVGLFGGRTGVTGEGLDHFLYAIPMTRTDTAAGIDTSHPNPAYLSCNGAGIGTTGMIKATYSVSPTAPNLSDGNRDTNAWVNYGAPATLIYDLLQPRYLNHVDQVGYYGDGRTYTGWSWETSLDGITWSPACVKANYPTTSAGMITDLGNRYARYLRFKGQGSGFGSTDLVETEVWLNPDPPPSPAPSPAPSASSVPGTIGTGTTITHNPDGSVTETQLQPQPDGTIRVVSTVTRPDGSKQVTTTYTDADGNPLTDPAPSVVEIPAPGSGTEPSEGTDSDAHGCMGSWTWNPVAWVYRPVKCALQWAFVPDSDAMTEWTDQVDTIKGSGVFALGDTLGNFIGSVGNAGSSAYDCPTEAVGSYTNGRTTVARQSPIHWCDVIERAGDETQSSSWGQKLYLGAKIILFIYFAFLWYNRISATAGSQMAI